VSAVRRLIGIAAQTDAKISPANYGGPLFDIEGALIGICVPSAGQSAESGPAGVEWYDSGIGFAIHSDVLAARIERLKAGSDLVRGLLGLSVDAADPVVAAEGAPSTVPSARGVRVGEVGPGPAADAGIQSGDIITAIDGVATPTYTAFRRAMTLKIAGESVAIELVREGNPTTLRAKLVRAEELPK
jgi:serine protease Do